MTRHAAFLLVLAGFVVGCATAPAPKLPLTTPDEPEEPIEPVAVAAAPVATLEAIAPEPKAPPGPPPRIVDGGELFERLAASFSPPVCVRGEHNRLWRQRYAGSPDGFERQLQQALPLLGYVVETVEARGLPGEFALIPIIESGYRPEAVGPGGPTGLWQMIASTARNHGVQVGRDYDGRLSPVDSTTAALDYLAVLHAEFGDWRATAMAYNAGEGRIRRAFARDGSQRVSGERRLPAGLSGITYAYVAKLHALACLIAEPARHGLTLPTETFIPLDVRRAPASTTRLDAAARAWGTTATELARWNPAYRQGIAASGAPRQLLVPASAVSVAITSPATTDSATPGDGEPAKAESLQHVVRSGDTLWQIARRYNTSVRAIAAENGLDARRPLRIGRRLTIPH
jgi:membrane-bound lytic murein transglycosylase D